MTNLAHKQREALKDEKRFEIYHYLLTQPRPLTLGLIVDGVEKTTDLAQGYYHLGELERVGLVEKVGGDNPATYRAVEL